MNLATWFWLIYVLGLLFGSYGVFRSDPPNRIWTGGFSLLVYILIGILGWALFQSPVKG